MTTTLLKDLITTLNHKCNIWSPVDQTPYHPSVVSKAVDIVTQHITEEHVRELDLADMAEDMAGLKDHHKLTFREAEGNEDTEEDTIMVQEVVDMAEVGIPVVGLITHKDRCLFDGMAGFAVVVDEASSSALTNNLDRLS
ncbi:hypothetical protein KCU81_g9291, partial [Aureobasidium melanogenum]